MIRPTSDPWSPSSQKWRRSTSPYMNASSWTASGSTGQAVARHACELVRRGVEEHQLAGLRPHRPVLDPGRLGERRQEAEHLVAVEAGMGCVRLEWCGERRVDRRAHPRGGLVVQRRLGRHATSGSSTRSLIARPTCRSAGRSAPRRRRADGDHLLDDHRALVGECRAPGSMQSTIPSSRGWSGCSFALGASCWPAPFPCGMNASHQLSPYPARAIAVAATSRIAPTVTPGLTPRSSRSPPPRRPRACRPGRRLPRRRRRCGTCRRDIRARGRRSRARRTPRRRASAPRAGTFRGRCGGRFPSR